MHYSDRNVCLLLEYDLSLSVWLFFFLVNGVCGARFFPSFHSPFGSTNTLTTTTTHCRIVFSFLTCHFTRKARGSSQLMLVEAGAPMCVCAGSVSGSIDGIAFTTQCQPRPRSDLLALDNDICNLQTYEGGLKCCSHKSILLDLNQTIPPAVDTYRMKFRLYYEE